MDNKKTLHKNHNHLLKLTLKNELLTTKKLHYSTKADLATYDYFLYQLFNTSYIQSNKKIIGKKYNEWHSYEEILVCKIKQ